jgi:hypothetical protein
MNRSETMHASESLPPPDAWLIDPRQEKIETPLDERNLIDIPKLIGAIKLTVDPSYQWGGELDVHHFYWPEALSHCQAQFLA